MKNNVLDITTFTDQELIDELEVRLAGRLPDPRQMNLLPSIPNLKPTITPYEIMCKMILHGWKENPVLGKSDPRIDKMWAYLGYSKFTDDDSYCAATVNACLKLAGYETSDGIPASRSLESYGKEVSITDAKEGDIVNFQVLNTWKGHVGFLNHLDDETLLVAGGNQSDKMCIKEFSFYSKNLVLKGFRRITEMNRVSGPDWETIKKWGLI